MGIEQGKISNRQALLLICNSILASMILVSPALLAQEAGQDAWITVLIGGVLGLLMGIFVISLGLRFPQKNLVEYSIELLGPWLGKAVCIIFALFFLYLTAYLINSFSALLITENRPDTPVVVLNTFLIILVAYGVYLGLEVFSRVNEIVFPIFIVVFLFIFSLAVPEMDFEQLKPIFTYPPSRILWGSLILFSFYAEGAFILMLIPSLQKPEQARKTAGIVSGILTVIMLIDVVGLIALFGSLETARMAFPTYELAKTVHLGGFLERIEALVIGVWVGSVSLKIMTFFYVSVLTFAEVFDLKEYRPLVLPYAIILVVLSIIGWGNTTHIRIFLSCYFPLLAVTVLAGLTLFLYLALIGSKSGNKGGKVK